MLRTIVNWLRLDAQNFIAEVWWAALILWIALVVMGIVDVSTNVLGRGAKIAWVAVIVLIPLAGLFAYSLLSLARADYHMLEFLFRKRKSGKRRNSRASASTSQILS